MAMDGSSAVPQDVIKCLHTITSRFEQVESNLRDVLKACDPDVMAEMPPLDRAYAFLTLANAVAILYTLQLRCSGESLEDNPFQKELERVELYGNKVEYYTNMSQAHPMVKINTRAATRFIKNSLPDLTPEQKNDLRSISKGEGHWSKSRETHGNKKRKYEPLGKSSIAEAAAAFLAETSKELFGRDSLVEQVQDESEEGEIVEEKGEIVKD